MGGGGNQWRCQSINEIFLLIKLKNIKLMNLLMKLISEIINNTVLGNKEKTNCY